MGQVHLPLPPLCMAAPGEEDRADEAVIVTYLDNRKLSGRLVAFSLDEASISVFATAENLTLIIAIAEIKLLQLTRPRRVVKLQQTVAERGPGVIVPHERQDFEVIYKDSSKLSGKTFGFRAHRSGVHFFSGKVEGEYFHLFVPFTAIKDYRIGPQLGQALVKEKLVSAKDLKTGLREQEKIRSQPIGEYLKSMVVVSAEDLQAALARQKAMPTVRLGDVLLKEELITQAQLNEALAQQQKNRQIPLGEILVTMGLIGADALKQTLAKKLGIPFVDLRHFQVDPAVIKLVPEDLARKLQVMPLYMCDGRLALAIENPMQWEAIEAVRFRTKIGTEAVMATADDIRWAHEHYYGRPSDALGFEGLEELEELEVVAEEEEVSVAKAKREGEEKPVVRFVDSLLLDAVRQRASDIHIRPGSKGVDILFRIDGVLKPIRAVSRTFLLPLVSRIKIMSSMNIAERRRPQDGRIRLKSGARMIDFRVSVMPTVNGESVVMRVQDKGSAPKTLSTLGFKEEDQKDLIDMLHRNAGIILVTGATGSGKSSTLYAALQKLVERNLHVITVEDPVEAEVAGAEQIQVNNAAGYTFASALRNILRHDPDAIMVGEIRDQETAKIALESAMTGHLVLSTLHTNDAPSTINRLLEMGIEPFILGVSLLGVLSQRLVRVNCPHCSRPEAVAPDIAQRLGVTADTQFRRGAGCPECNNTGCAGRTTAYELLRITPEIRRMINEERSAAEIRQAANAQGMVDLTQHAVELAKQGTISLEQAYLVKQQ